MYPYGQKRRLPHPVDMLKIFYLSQYFEGPNCFLSRAFQALKNWQIEDRIWGPDGTFISSPSVWIRHWRVLWNIFSTKRKQIKRTTREYDEDNNHSKSKAFTVVHASADGVGTDLTSQVSLNTRANCRHLRVVSDRQRLYDPTHVAQHCNEHNLQPVASYAWCKSYQISVQYSR